MVICGLVNSWPIIIIIIIIINGVGTLSFAAGNADNEFRSFAQEAVVALEEVKRRSSAETAP